MFLAYQIEGFFVNYEGDRDAMPVEKEEILR